MILREKWRDFVKWTRRSIGGKREEKMAAIYRGPRRGYKLTDDDVLWLARAMVGEAGEGINEQEAAALFHCWMDRLHLVNARWSQEGWSLRQLIQAHSQPVNPLWIDPDGSKCRQHPQYCTAAHIARRKRIQGLSRAQLEQIGSWRFALMAQAGDLPRTIAEPTYDFAACSLTGKQSRPCKGIDLGGNCFLNYDCLKASEKQQVIPGEVVVEGVIPAPGVSLPFLGVLIAGAGGLFAWYLYSR
jgi:hypothetical protein